MSRESKWIVGGAVLVAGAVIFGSWNWRLYSKAELRLGQARTLEAHEQSLRAEVDAGALLLREMMDSLRSASNRMAEVERQLDVEKKTHDPIRAQIEKMLTEQIGMKDKLDETQRRLVESERLAGDLQKQKQGMASAPTNQTSTASSP